MNCVYVYSAMYKRDPISVELHEAGFYTGNTFYMNDRFDYTARLYVKWLT